MAEIGRRHLLAGLAALGAGACSRVGESENAGSIFDAAESWHREAHRILAGRERLAPEFEPSDISPNFRGNGSLTVDTPEYREELANGFPNWRLEVTGLVAKPLSLSLETLRALPQRVQITRHDCVEGWSAIGEWTGPQLSTILDAARVLPEANFIVLRCADTLYGRRYYESVDMVDAYHPQTIIAHRLNGENLPEKNGAPLRMRIERQLGYKHAKYLTGIEAVASLDAIGEGKGGFWEDIADYQWYAGI
ncbi:molybdopterin-dependent oxidoreductase [Erythrobacter sp. HL-111]|uniref:molybdopterin-dependent oxidoreductase n=1 Tax=Erythrobacter sp. HL-111 TaxID=1798193 RepID=UPI0006DA38BB|nr:molybdopterin-dependent oxidoreductase [Erythrobacter sp. HL-111]KPP94972.1 MAG: sulfoxide reductase catalytic subunit YedY [Erythrobacteraceae bacterium HL-111]SDS14101.1 Oxidoreductase molybdopterin binding domain-containing protein [Erythrobacter sp. HL-111]